MSLQSGQTVVNMHVLDGYIYKLLACPEAKSVKNRLHLDLRPTDQAGEVERILALGARRVHVGQTPDATWVVLADPEGNEFCVLAPFTPEQLASIG